MLFNPPPKASSAKIFGLLFTIGLGLGISQSFASNTVSISPVSAQSKSSQPAMPSDSLRSKIISTMHQELGGDRQTFKITKIEPTLWQNCPPGANQLPPSATCKPVNQGGWRVQVTGQRETWTYYVTNGGNIQLDGPASISPKTRQTLVKNLAYAPQTQLKILAARPIGFLPNCDSSSALKPCNTRPIPHWQILLEQRPRPITLDLQGKIIQPGSLKSFLPKNLAGLDPNFAEAVLHDVRDRHLGTLPPNLQIESLKKTTWALCNSGGKPAPGPGPSQPMTGPCPIGTSSGWQVITRSGPMRWIHYVQPFSMEAWTPESGFTLASLVSPDGPQSLPKALATAAIEATAKKNRKRPEDYRIHWAESLFFDGCLNPTNPLSAGTPNLALACRQRIQSGWQVQVMGQGTNGMQRVSTYHMSLVGNEWRLISENDWVPPPMAAPIGSPK
jgi:hypothetical protein